MIPEPVIARIEATGGLAGDALMGIGTVALAAAPEPLTKVGAVALGAYTVDSTRAHGWQLLSGERHRTLAAAAPAYVATELFGANEQTANGIGAVSDFFTSLVLSRQMSRSGVSIKGAGTAAVSRPYNIDASHAAMSLADAEALAARHGIRLPSNVRIEIVDADMLPNAYARWSSYDIDPKKWYEFGDLMGATAR